MKDAFSGSPAMKRSLFEQRVRQRLALERGRIDKDAPFRVALAYPSPYRVAMSSLGYQQIYRGIQTEPGMSCERVFVPDDAGGGPLSESALSYEHLRPLNEFPVVALSVAYELELAGVVQLLEAAGIPSLRSERDVSCPVVVAGGPLTFSNPMPLAAYVDVIVMGEADALGIEVLRILRDASDRTAALLQLAALDHVFVPMHHETLPSVAKCADALLPAWSAIRTPDTELSDMFLVEAERGCSRGCNYCVMRRSTNGGMRIVSQERLLELVPEDAARVGLVGAAVSDHPQIIGIVSALADRGAEVGLSSLRPDRLTDAFVAALRRGGARTLTTAMDGASDRIREILDRRARVRHLENAARLVREHRLARLKLYLMLGVPGEEDVDIDQCVSLVAELSRLCSVALTIAPFCAKRNTPLDGQPYAGIKTVTKRVERLKRGLRGRADVRSTSPRWAWVEYVLAQGGQLEGRAVRDAVHAGGSFAAYKAAFAQLPELTKRRQLHIVRRAPSDGRRHERWLEPA